MTSRWRLFMAVGMLMTTEIAASAIDPPAVEAPLCQRLKTHCVVAHYCPKPAPCVSCDYQSTCAIYCKKPDVCTESCFEWCTSIYCKKPEPCYPGDPCERQVWHAPACPPPCTLVTEATLVAQRFAY